MLENETLKKKFNGFHNSTLVQIIGNKSADLGLFFSIFLYYSTLGLKPDGDGPLDIILILVIS